ncbi:MAG: glycosyltransferase family 4 protein [Bacteroidetes bacterium]|nr:glycosyltransferase family 4 protein [Bacteroidota bacterium]
MKILFFIGTLSAGGKERRLVELLAYLIKKKYDLMIVLRRNEIEYPVFNELNIPYKILTKKYKKGDKTLHFKFYKICKEFKPDIIHTWGSMPAFVSLLAHIILRIPHINSQITDAPPNIKKWSFQNLINKINFKFSTIILSNSFAGLKAYKVENKKTKVIYNGVDLQRFINIPNINRIKEEFGIKTPFSIIMVASFIKYKDHNLLLDIAKELALLRNDVSFLAVGEGYNLEKIRQRVKDETISNIIFTGKISNVEHLINCCEVGVLFSPLGEGISNAIIEYMALGKPVIANDLGGTKEIVKDGINGYLITNDSPLKIACLINNLLNNQEKRLKMGEVAKKRIEESFTIDKMGKKFEKVYLEVLS